MTLLTLLLAGCLQQGEYPSPGTVERKVGTEYRAWAVDQGFAPSGREIADLRYARSGWLYDMQLEDGKEFSYRPFARFRFTVGEGAVTETMWDDNGDGLIDRYRIGVGDGAVDFAGQDTARLSFYLGKIGKDTHHLEEAAKEEIERQQLFYAAVQNVLK